MLKIIKKSLKEEPFSLEKITTSISASSDEAQQPLNTSDLHNIASELAVILEGKTTIETRHIRKIIIGILYDRGLNKVLEAYAAYEKNTSKQ